jgi:hypothetical protein
VSVISPSSNAVVVTTNFRGIHTPDATPKHNLPLELKVEQDSLGTILEVYNFTTDFCEFCGPVTHIISGAVRALGVKASTVVALVEFVTHPHT